MIPPHVGKESLKEAICLCNYRRRKKLKAEVHVNGRCLLTLPTANSGTSNILLENTNAMPAEIPITL